MWKKIPRKTEIKQVYFAFCLFWMKEDSFLSLLIWVLYLRTAKHIPLTDQFTPIESYAHGLKRKMIPKIIWNLLIYIEEKSNWENKTKSKRCYFILYLLGSLISVCVSFSLCRKCISLCWKRSQDNINRENHLKPVKTTAAKLQKNSYM